MIVSPSVREKRLVISVGVVLFVVVPSPNSQKILEPHIKTRPVDVMAEE